MTLKIDSPQGDIRNLKYRKEGNGEAGSVPLDISITCLTAGSVLKTLLGRSGTDIFWSPNGDKAVTFPWLEKCTVTSKITHCHMNIGGVDLKNCTLSKFSFVPKDGGHIELSFNAAAMDVAGQDVDKLRPMLKSSAPIKAEGGDLVDMTEEDESESEEEQLDLD